MKKVAIIGAILLLVVLVNFGIPFFFKGVRKDPGKGLECYGVIEGKKESKNRATPYFLIDGEWKYIGLIGYNVYPHVIVSDSIAKSKTDDEVKIYRLDSFGSYKLFAVSRSRKTEFVK